MALVAARAAEPASAPRPFSIRSQPYAGALVDFALQAGLSLGGIGACTGTAPALHGDFTPEEALRRLLAGAPCRFEFAEPGTVRLTALPPRTETAAAPPAAPPSPPEEVTVTATKRPGDLDRLPDAVSVIPSAQLAATGSVDVADTVGRIAGMNMTNLGPGRDKIMLRGLSDGAFTGRTQSTVGTYLDDLPVTYNAPDPDLRLSDVEVIEVLRGPQGALYGSGSLSGIYRIVTRKPDPDTYAAGASVGYGWTEGASTSRQADGMVNLPLAEGIAALRVVAYGDLDGGYLNNGDLRQSDVDRTTRTGGRAALEVRLGDDWRVTAGGVVQTLDSADAQYIVGSRPRNRANRVGESNDNDFSQASLVIAGSGDWGRLDSSAAYIHHATANRYDASAALSLFDDTTTTDIGIYDETTATDLLIEDLVASSTGDGPLQWLAGVYGASLLERTGDALHSRGAGGRELLRYQEARTDRQLEWAPYGEASYDFGAGWIATAGARLFGTSLDTVSNVTLPHPRPPRPFRDSGFYGGWSPKVSLRHEFDPDAMVYLLYSEGYRAGGYNSGGIAAPTAAQQSFAPDRLRNIETGAKTRLLDGVLELRTALFYDLWSDIQTDQYLPSGLSYTTNVGSARVLGWENEAWIRPLPGLTLGLNDLLSTARLSGSTAAPLITNGLPGVPNLSLGATADYEIPLDADFTLRLGGEVDYVGRSRLTFQPNLSPWMGRYFTSRLDAGIATETWRLGAVLDNATNTQGDTFSFGNPFSFGQVRQVTPLRPRTVRLILSANF